MSEDVHRGPGDLMAAVSSMVVGVYADHLGRGPTKARSHLGKGLITCVLHDTLTQPERLLVDSGEIARVQDLRASLQERMRPALIEGLERVSGWGVQELISGDQVGTATGVQVFLVVAS